MFSKARYVAFSGAIGLMCALASPSESAATLQVGPFQAPHGLAIFVRAEGPATRVTPLQVSCFFEHQSSGDVLSGGTEDFNKKMGGLIEQLRESGDFTGHELETLLLTPPPNTVPAKKVLLIGLGDPSTFLAERMSRVATVAAREAFKLGVEKFSFSPNVTDAGVKVVSVGSFDEQVIEGVLRAVNTQARLADKRLVPPLALREFTLEAGKENVAPAQDAVKTAIKTVENQKGNPK